jgi:signal transduction histidine kinase
VALIDRKMCIVNLNARWARMTGVDLATARGRVLYDAAPSFEERRPAYERVMSGEPVHLTNVPYQVPGEDKVHYRDIYLRPVRDLTGAVTGMLNAVIDVTERHTLDQQKDALIALASHELRTPITAIKGYTQLGLRAAGAGVSGMDERLARTLRIVNEKADLLTRLVNEMLDVSRIQSGTLPLEMESFDLGQLIKEVTAGAALTQPDFIFALDLPPTPIEVHADRQRIEQVLTNLIQNAIKYSGASRRVEIALKAQDNQVTTSVRDFGIGIPAGQQSQLFDRFFRASNVKSTQQSGLGLGLYISHDIIARHGGRMWCESTEGQGSTFYFALPLVVG